MEEEDRRRPWTLWTASGRDRYETTCSILRHMPDPWPFNVAERLSIQSTTGSLPELSGDASFADPRRNSALPKMAALPIAPGADFGFLKVLSPLSQDGTSQGTVFQCEAFSKSSRKYTRLALKKSLVPQLGDWKCYLGRLANLSAEECRARLSVRSDREDRSVAPEESARRRILARWSSPTTEHLMDAVATATLSDLVLQGFTPFHPVCYGTFRCYDTGWWDAPCHSMHAVERSAARTRSQATKSHANGRKEGSAIPCLAKEKETDRAWVSAVRAYPPPVQLVAQEMLDGTVRSLARDGAFGTGLGFRWNLLHAFLAQITWGLAIAQRERSFVNNDAHWSNLMFRRTDPDAYLRYAELDADDVPTRCHDVPTHGFVLALVDPGRSSFKALGLQFRSEFVPDAARVALAGKPDSVLRFDNFSADLVRTSLEVSLLLRSARVVDSDLRPIPNAVSESNRPHAEAVLALCRKWRTVRDDSRAVDFDLETYRRHVDADYAHKEPDCSQERRDEMRSLAQHEAYVWAPIYKEGWTWNARPRDHLPSFDRFFAAPIPEECLDSHSFVLRASDVPDSPPPAP